MVDVRRFGRFWLHERIGQGGMAEVFRASVGPDPDSYAFECAIKRLHPHIRADRRYTDLFKAEQFVAGTLRHPNIIETYETDSVEAFDYIAMELVRGSDLSALLRDLNQRSLRLPPEIALYVTLQVLRGIDYMHRATAAGNKPLNIVHRDIDPTNLFLFFDGQVKLGDFGVASARLLDDPAETSILRGKPFYMPPEVLTGAAPYSQADDLWAISVCLLESLTMQPAFGDLSPEQVITRGMAPKLPSGEDPRVPIDKKLLRLLGILLHTNPKRRPSSAANMYGLLRRYMQEAGINVDQETLSRFVFATLGDATQLLRHAELAVRDTVTGCYNNRHLLEQLRIEVDRAKRYQRVLSVLHVDIDDCTVIQQSYGAPGAQQVIVKIAEMLNGEAAGLRSSDLVARRGGDRFCVILPETPVEGGENTAERLRRTIEDYDWRQLDPEFNTGVHISVGVSSYPAHGETVGSLLQAAEMACQRAKRDGKNRCMRADENFYALKSKVADGTANEAEVTRWIELNREYAFTRNQPSQRHFFRTDLSIEVEFRSEREFVHAYAEDIGGGGVRVRVSTPVQEGALVELKLRLPNEDDDSQEVRVAARVAWVRKDSDVIGLEFVDIPAELQRRIEALVWSTCDVDTII